MTRHGSGHGNVFPTAPARRTTGYADAHASARQTVGDRAAAVGPFAWGNQDDATRIAASGTRVERSVSDWDRSAGTAGYGLGTPRRSWPARCATSRPTTGHTSSPRPGLVWTRRNSRRHARRIGDPLSLAPRGRGLTPPARCASASDLYQMHWPAEDGTPLEDYWGPLLQLKEEGKVRAVGLPITTWRSSTPAERLGARGHPRSRRFSAIRRESRGRGASLVRCTPHGGHRLQPDAVGPPDGAFHLERAAALGADDWALSLSRLYGPWTAPQCRPGGTPLAAIAEASAA